MIKFILFFSSGISGFESCDNSNILFLLFSSYIKIALESPIFEHIKCSPNWITKTHVVPLNDISNFFWFIISLSISKKISIIFWKSGFFKKEYIDSVSLNLFVIFVNFLIK